MATSKKIIGKVPVYRGEWKNGVIYYKHNIVSMLGSSFISLIDDNSNTPAQFDKGSYSLHDTWAFFADGSFNYIEKQSKEFIPQSEFEALRDAGQLEIWKTYNTYEG